VPRVSRTRSTWEVSLHAVPVPGAGLGMRLVHGSGRGGIPVVAANGAALAPAGTVLFLKLRPASAAAGRGAAGPLTASGE
jgi:hypothetical protein